jgi:hypothetical protein
VEIVLALQLLHNILLLELRAANSTHFLLASLFHDVFPLRNHLD